MEKIKAEIAGEIALSDDPGATMKKWRDIFNIAQVELAKHLKITVSTISDYEGSRRKSPGAGVIKRFVNALFDIDQTKGGQITAKFAEKQKPVSDFFEVHEFARAITLRDFVGLIKGQVLSNDDLVDSSSQALLRFRRGGFIQIDSDEQDEVKYFKGRRTERYYTV